MSTKSTEESFFEGKRPWSVIKDQVIGSYIPGFVAKVAKLNRPILLIDAYAGPGVFEDGEAGSPLIICKSASRVAQWNAVFINSNRAHHDKLTGILDKSGLSKNAKAILGNSTEYLRDLSQRLRDETIFLYLDPFGLKGCDFQVIRLYLEKASSTQSVEVLVNMSMPTLHRLAAAQAIADGKKDDPQIVGLNLTLTRVLGGNWWQEIMWTRAEPSWKEQEVMKRYVEQLQIWLPFAGYCPVRENADAAVKYYITFASRHPDGLLLMNDIMCKAYGDYIFSAEAGLQTTLWGWETGRDLAGLGRVIVKTLRDHPDSRREDIWASIIQNNFMQWLQKEYHQVLKDMSAKGKIDYLPDPQTGRRNPNSKLRLRD